MDLVVGMALVEFENKAIERHHMNSKNAIGKSRTRATAFPQNRARLPFQSPLEES